MWKFEARRFPELCNLHFKRKRRGLKRTQMQKRGERDRCIFKKDFRRRRATDKKGEDGLLFFRKKCFSHMHGPKLSRPNTWFV